MKNKVLFFLSMLFFSQSVWAMYELNGSLTDMGGNGTYTVSVENDEGHVYLGTAVEVGSSGIIQVNVSDPTGESYTGTASPDPGGEGYILHLKNPVSGVLATGTLDEDQSY